MTRAAIPLVPLALLAASLPFEVREGVRLRGGLMLTNVEVALALYLVVSCVLRPGRGLRRPSLEVVAVLVWLAVLLGSALFASAAPGSSLKFAARLSLGPLVFLAASRDVEVARGRSVVAGALLGGALVSALFGLVESYRILDLSSALVPFRPYITTDQGVLRLNGSFQHANLAAGSLELMLPIALASAVLAILKPRRPALIAALRFGSYTLLCWALILTISRAGMASGALGVCVATLALCARLPRSAGFRVAALSASGFVLAALLSSGLASAVRARLFGLPANLHGVSYAVEPSMVVRKGAPVQLKVGLRNTGFLTWRHRPPNPFRLAYHWVDSRGATIVFEGARTSLPRDVPSGDGVVVDATIWSPAEPGDYVLLWDLVHERVTWFSQRANPAATTFVRVIQGTATSAAPPAALPSWTRSVPTEMEPWVENELVPRGKLWSIALSHAAAHPLLGIGPGRFGATYPAGLAPGRYDAGLSAHNLYLELASTTGALGLGAFLMLIALIGRRLAAALTRRVEATTPDVVWAAAGLGVLTAFLSHGLFDCFLASHPVSLGLWIALAVSRPSGG